MHAQASPGGSPAVVADDASADALVAAIRGGVSAVSSSKNRSISRTVATASSARRPFSSGGFKRPVVELEEPHVSLVARDLILTESPRPFEHISWWARVSVP